MRCTQLLGLHDVGQKVEHASSTLVLERSEETPTSRTPVRAGEDQEGKRVAETGRRKA